MTARPLDSIVGLGPGRAEDEVDEFDVALSECDTVEDVERLVPEIGEARERLERHGEVRRRRQQRTAVRRMSRTLERRLKEHTDGKSHT